MIVKFGLRIFWLPMVPYYYYGVWWPPYTTVASCNVYPMRWYYYNSTVRSTPTGKPLSLSNLFLWDGSDHDSSLSGSDTNEGRTLHPPLGSG